MIMVRPDYIIITKQIRIAKSDYLRAGIFEVAAISSCKCPSYGAFVTQYIDNTAMGYRNRTIIRSQAILTD